MTVVGVRSGQLSVERALVSTLELWMPHYVVAAARRYAAEGALGLTSEVMEAMLSSYELPFRPRGISVSSDFEDWPVDALPHLQVLSPSWSIAGGDQTGAHIKYDIQVAALVGAQEREDTRLLRACYEDAVIGVIDQHQKLGGLAAGIDIVGGGPAQLSEISAQDARTFQGSIAVFEVLVMGVVSPQDGPTGEPLPDEGDVPPVWPDDPTLAEDGATVTLVPEAISGDS